MTRRRCLDCQDGRHTGHVPAGTVLALCRRPNCDPEPIQARLFSHTLVEHDLGSCVDCGQPATTRYWSAGSASRPSFGEACEYRGHQQATGGPLGTILPP
jgi:hypothetical protein